ncbi:MAG: glycosyltransferase [Bacteroidota bacterium]
MKILLVITKSEIGGAQVFILNLARSLKNMGHQVEVAAGDGNYLFTELENNGIIYHYLNSLKRNFNIPKALYFIFDLYRLLKKNNYDIIHLNSSNTLIGALSSYFFVKRPKIVFTFHGLSLLDKNYQTNFFLKYLTKTYYKIFLKIIDESVFVSQSNFTEMQDAGITKDAKVIMNGLDSGNMNFISAKEAREYFSDLCKVDFMETFLLGSTGRLSYQKNYDFLIDNFSDINKKIPNARVIIIGDGPDREILSRKIKLLSIDKYFFFLGAIKDSFRYIKAFDLFVLPSRYEGLSISLIEAIFAGIPILASNVGGNSEIVGIKSPQLFNLNDPEDFLRKLIDIKNNRSLIVDSNISIKNKFALEKMTLSYENLYKSLLND